MKSDKGPVCELKLLTQWTTLCVLLALVLVLKTGTDGLPLDMATNSIDDMFDGCRSEVASRIDQVGMFEWLSENFSVAWALAEKKAKKPVHQFLNEDHAIAMDLYTRVKDIQEEFDEAVKTGERWYNTDRFRFHYFYFYLIDAIRVLRHNELSCRTSYHSTCKRFNRNVVNTSMRFGAFTLVAPRKQSFTFSGMVSCFEIYSCFGADITYYSAINETGQVLIPPYEVFKVTDVLTHDPWCSVVYKLRSTEIPRSDLNCKLSLRQNTTPSQLDGQASTVDMSSAYLMLLIIITLILVKLRRRRFVAAVLTALMVLMTILVVVLTLG